MFDISSCDDLFPVVLRFEGLWPHQLGRFLMHALRNGGDLEHVDEALSALNRQLIGTSDWHEKVLAEIAVMREENRAEELAALDRLRRRKEMRERAAAGLTDPWRPSEHGPMREVILTANRNHFEPETDREANARGAGGQHLSPDGHSRGIGPKSARKLARKRAVARRMREQAFEARAVSWLTENFGDDVVYARCDRDETAYHVHAVILPRAETRSQRRGVQTLLQLSIHPLIRDYEAAQDSVGRHFADLGLERGARTAEARRIAKALGEKPGKRRKHVRTWKWRDDETRRLCDLADTLADESVALAATQGDLLVSSAQQDLKAGALARRNDVVTRREAAAAQVDNNLATRSGDLDRREAKVDARSTAVAEREDAVDAMEAVLDGVATGALALPEDHTSPLSPVPAQTPEEVQRHSGLLARISRAPKAARRIGAVLVEAYGRMRSDADVKAEARYRDAITHASAAAEFAGQIDTEAEAFAGKLPPGEATTFRQRLLQLRAVITTKLGQASRAEPEKRETTRPAAVSNSESIGPTDLSHLIPIGRRRRSLGGLCRSNCRWRSTAPRLFSLK